MYLIIVVQQAQSMSWKIINFYIICFILKDSHLNKLEKPAVKIQQHQ